MDYYKFIKLLQDQGIDARLEPKYCREIIGHVGNSILQDPFVKNGMLDLIRGGENFALLTQIQEAVGMSFKSQAYLRAQKLLDSTLPKSLLSKIDSSDALDSTIVAAGVVVRFLVATELYIRYIIMDCVYSTQIEYAWELSSGE